MILESDTPAVTQFSVGDLKAGDKFRVLFPVFNRAEGLRVSVRKQDGSLEELKLNQGYAVLIPPNSGQAGYTAEVEYIGEERTDIYVFIVERAIRLSQETNLSSYGAEGRNQEFSLDKLTCILQDTRTGLRISSSEVNNPLTGTPELELPYNRENSILAFDENKNVRAVPEYTGEEGVKISEHNVVSMDMDTMPVATEDHSGVMSKEDKVKVNALGEVAFSGLNESSGLNIEGNVLNLNTASVSSRGGIRLVPEGTVLNNLFKTWGSEGLAIAPLPPAGDAPDKLGGVFIDLSDGENLTKINEDGKLTTAVPLASRERDGLMSKSDKANMEDLHIIAYSGLYMDLSNKPNNASITSDGFMSKEDKIKLNAAMKFPDGETGYTLPNASGRADKLITFDSNGNVTLHGTYGYDNWRNIRVSENEALAETNFVLPNPTERANKVIGFSSDGKSVEMREVGGTDITVGKGLQKNGNEISLKPLKDGGELGGICIHHDADEGLYVDNYGRLSLKAEEGLYVKHSEYPLRAIALQKASASSLGGIKVGSGLNIDGNGVLSAKGGDSSDGFINEPVFTGDLVTERIDFVDRGNENYNVTCVASFVVDGKKTFFRGSTEYIDNAYRKYIYRSHDCITWQKTEVSCKHKITSFLQSGGNILFATSLEDVPYDGEVFLSSDGGHSFVRRALSFQYFKGWVESQGNILLCSYHGLYISEDCGNTWNTVPNSVNGIFSSPVFFKGKFYFLHKIKELEDYKNITSITVSDNTFTIEHTFIDNHIPVSLAVDNNYIYAVVKNDTGYPETYIYSAYAGSNFTLIQTYNNQYIQLLGKPNTWLFISYDKNAWFCKKFSDVPVRVHSLMNTSSSNYHYSIATDLFMIQDAGLLVSTKAYIIGS